MKVSPQQVERLIREHVLHFRHPVELEPEMKRFEKGRMTEQRARRLLKKIRPWLRTQITEKNYLPISATSEDFGLDTKPFDVELGMLTERPETPFGMYLNSGVHHILIIGKPGAGKTVTLKVYIKGVLESLSDDPPVFIVFDYKRDLINPERIFGDNCVHIPLADPSKFRISLAPPGNVPPHVWSGPVCSVPAGRLGMIVSRFPLIELYQWLYGLRAAPPSIALMLDCLVQAPSWCWGNKIDYINFLAQALEGLLIEGQGTFDAQTGFDVTGFIESRTHCILDVANLNPVCRRYVVYDLILLQILVYVVHNQMKTDRVRICIVVDEADFLARQAAQEAYHPDLSPLNTLARLAREYGIQLILCVSGLQNVADYIRTGCDCLIALKSTDAESIWMLQKTLGVPHLANLMAALPPGQCIYRYASCSYPYPMLGQVKFIEPDHSRSKTRPYDSIEFTEATRLEALPDVKKALQHRIEERSRDTLRKSRAKTQRQSLAKKEITFLKFMSLHEYKPLNLIFDEMGVTSAGVQGKIIEKLVAQKYIEAVTFRSESSWFRLGWLTDKGWEFNHDRSKYKPTRGDHIHTTISYNIMFLGQKRGYQESACEKQLPGNSGFCDAFHRIDGRLHVYEVIIGTDQNVGKHARDAFVNCSEPVASLTFVTALKSEHKKLEQMILSDPELAFHISKIRFTTAARIFKETWS